MSDDHTPAVQEDASAAGAATEAASAAPEEAGATSQEADAASEEEGGPPQVQRGLRSPLTRDSDTVARPGFRNPANSRSKAVRKGRAKKDKKRR